MLPSHRTNCKAIGKSQSWSDSSELLRDFMIGRLVELRLVHAFTIALEVNTHGIQANRLQTVPPLHHQVRQIPEKGTSCPNWDVSKEFYLSLERIPLRFFYRNSNSLELWLVYTYTKAIATKFNTSHDCYVVMSRSEIFNDLRFNIPLITKWIVYRTE